MTDLMTEDREIHALAGQLEATYRNAGARLGYWGDRALEVMLRQVRAALAAPLDESREDQIARMRRDLAELNPFTRHPA